MRANPGTCVCPITLVRSESCKFILVRKLLRLFISSVNYNVRSGFQKYLNIFLHNLPFTHDTLNRCPAGSSCPSVHFTPFPVSLISAFSSRNWMFPVKVCGHLQRFAQVAPLWPIWNISLKHSPSGLCPSSRFENDNWNAKFSFSFLTQLV